MGWARGTMVMEKCISFAKRNVNDETERGTFYKFMIDILEEQDWDCQAECMGRILFMTIF